ncbi:unnamed protein product [Rotaria socialis]|uniref:Uncharacterized protein n=1 Tax=Rotaria socialis TaxID=392032 RepID=A0A817XU40_9BILA|nr:unnamed protein product [Rotaria socialis]CAF3570664.1 unnamed protein product [Rotaria socialis]CAF4547897.1 unnamed protein product [Rotaria socialis]CAF4844814.1 unnamed protein product [Rotaria socialis]
MSMERYREHTMNVTTVGNNGVVAVVRETTMEIGQPRATGVIAFIRRTYPASYNHVVRNMHSIDAQMNTKKKRSMRGGHLLLYRYTLILAIVLCFSFGIASIFAKPCAVVPFVLSVLYIALSIYNIVIFFLNRPLINILLTRQVHRGVIAGGFINEFYTVPVNATVQTGAIAAFIDPAVIAAAVKRENIQLTEIKVMLYDDRYLRRSKFPKEIILHLIVFIILFILAIIFVITKS